MKIKEILSSPQRKNLEVTGRITKMESIALRMRTLVKATLMGDTGSIVLNLWGTQANQCQVGDLIKVKDAYVKIYRGVAELNTWKDIEVLDRSKSTP